MSALHASPYAHAASSPICANIRTKLRPLRRRVGSVRGAQLQKRDAGPQNPEPLSVANVMQLRILFHVDHSVLDGPYSRAHGSAAAGRMRDS
jgi:hypothetical protein